MAQSEGGRLKLALQLILHPLKRLSSLRKTTSIDSVRERAYLISRIYPWRTRDENWKQAEEELQRPSLLSPLISFWRWSGFGEKSDKKGLDAWISLSIPVLVFSGGILFNHWTGERQRETSIKERSDQLYRSAEERKDLLLREYIKEMRIILLDPKISTELIQSGSRAQSAARALTLVTLSQLQGGTSHIANQRRSLVFQFLKEAGTPLLSGANLSGLDLHGTNLKGSNLAGADLSGAKLQNAYMEDTDLSKAKLDNADLSRSKIYNSNLREATLVKARLKNAYIYGINLDSANLSQANLGKVFIYGGSFDKALLDGASLAGSRITVSNFTNANLATSYVHDCSVRPCKHTKHEIDLTGSILSYVSFSSADLSGLDMSKAEFSAAIFENAKVKDTICPNGELTSRGCPYIPLLP